MLEREFVYLVCPYTDRDDAIQYRRFLKVTEVGAELMRRGYIVFSPLTHCRPMAVQSNLPGNYRFWSRLNKAYIRHSHTVFVLPLEGWKESVGVSDEIAYAMSLDIPVLSLDVATCNVDWKFERNDPGWQWCEECETWHPSSHEHSQK